MCFIDLGLQPDDALHLLDALLVEVDLSIRVARHVLYLVDAVFQFEQGNLLPDVDAVVFEHGELVASRWVCDCGNLLTLALLCIFF